MELPQTFETFADSSDSAPAAALAVATQRNFRCRAFSRFSLKKKEPWI